MHINLESDYAIRIVASLAAGEKRMDAKAIAADSHVTLRFALKILSKLVKNNIVKSFKGSGGGYELGRLPAEITLYDVIETVEGPYALNRCLHGGCDCHHKESACRFHHAFEDISNMVIDQLKNVNFGE